MLEELLVPLVKRGHRVDVYLAKGVSGAPYEYRGITVHRRGSNWLTAAADADLLVTHLDQTSEVVGLAAAINKPVVQILHNTMAPTKMWASCKADLLVYNSEHMADEMGRVEQGIVVRPPVYASDYATRRSNSPWQSGFITLVNSSYRKGGALMAMMAVLLPHRKFLVMEGAYGEQIKPELPNVVYLSHASTPMTTVYANTSVLIMPSHYESWGRTGVEAMASGIPVIAAPTPGLLESLGDAGIFADVDDPWTWRSLADLLLSDPEAYAQASERSYSRSAELDPYNDICAWIDAVESF